jgi:hypothetical protein
MTCVLRKRTLCIETDLWAEHHVKIRVMLPQAKEISEVRKNGWNRSVLNVFEGGMALSTP